MDRLITALETVLKHETKEYTLMLALANEKKAILINNDVAGLERIVSREWIVLKKIKQFEMERENLIGKIAVLCHMPKETLRLEHIIDVLHESRREAFAVLRGELARVLSELSDINLVNKGLIDTHLAYSDFCVNLLTGHLNSTLGTYSYSGAMTDGQGNGNLLLDQMV